MSQCQGLWHADWRRGLEFSAKLALNFFSDVEPWSGPFLRRDVKGRVIPVIGSLVQHTPIGEARPCGWDEEGAQLWKVNAGGVELPGQYKVVNREFRPVL